VPELAAGAASSGSTTVAIPEGTATGTWYLIAAADGAGVVGEASETNNTYSRTIKIGPDLDITALSAPSAAAPGQTIPITDTTKNAGGGEAGPPRRRYSSPKTARSALTTSGRKPQRAGARRRSVERGVHNVHDSRGDRHRDLVHSSPKPTDRAPWPRHPRPITPTPGRSSSAPTSTSTALAAPSTAAAGQTISVTDTTKNAGAGAAGRR